MKERSCRLDIRLTVPGRRMLERLAARWGCTMTDAVAMCVTEAWAVGKEGKRAGKGGTV